MSLSVKPRHFQESSNSDTEPLKQHRWSFIFLSMAIIVASIWGVATAGAYWYFKSVRGLKTMTYKDVIQPTHWSNIREALGDLYIEEAGAALKRGEADLAHRLYRIGVARSPGNATGRISLAQLYVAFRRPELAEDVLIGGLPYLESNSSYLSSTLQFLFEFQYDNELQRICDQHVQSPIPSVRHVAAFQSAALALQRGDFDGAETLILMHHLDQTPDGSLVLARADLERGYPELAATRLQALVDTDSGATAALGMLAEVHNRTGRKTESLLTHALRIADDPLGHQPRLARLMHLSRNQESAILDAEIETYLRLFMNDQTALLALADFAANNGRPDLTRRIKDTFAQRNWPTDAPSLLYAEACIRATHYAEGLTALELYLRDNPQWAMRYGPAIDGLRTVALYGLNRTDDAQLQLEHLLGQSNLRAENLLVVTERLLSLGRPEAARLALSRAADLDPKNQAALAALVRLEAEQGYLDTLPAHLVKFLAVRRPSREVLNIAYRRIGSDLNLYQPDQQRLLVELRQRLYQNSTSAPRS